ncbi:hypothetical protein FNV43_RR06545 [Rhamnella rubrinervis]|uniref:Gnk2-homologous domain-containing protein n=1 Tax=Rhamnella rubrinervis TaxID=2594499 RepID=A0A8K0HD94_9ROSA|nr:hypothetical protein FNV43_RR06545 [Rhamnella rubrinervis]
MKILLLLHFAQVLAILLTLISTPCYAADNNTYIGSQCSIDDESTTNNEFQINLSNPCFSGSVRSSSLVWTNGTYFDDPSIASKVFKFMGELEQNASKQPLMFQTAELDIGKSGKNNGMAQCTRDISKADCLKCLDLQLEDSNKATDGWEIHGSSCFTSYQDYQFYFNISSPAIEGAGRLSSHKGAAIGLITSMLALVIVLC